MTLVQTTAEKIKTKGYWAITIRPAAFQETRISSRDQLFEIVHDTAASVNGRVIPAIEGTPDSLRHGPDWIEFATEWGTDLQTWRFYQSGQFVLLLANWTDWEETPPLRQVQYSSGRIFPLWDSMATVVAIYEFAARLSLTAAGSEQMVVSIVIKNLHDAELVQDNARKTPLRRYVFQGDVFEYPAGKTALIPRTELVGDSRRLAAVAANELVRQFGFDSTIETVSNWQAEFL